MAADVIPFNKHEDWFPHWRCPYCGKEVSSADVRVLGRCGNCGGAIRMPEGA